MIYYQYVQVIREDLAFLASYWSFIYTWLELFIKKVIIKFI
jgi:hypothetical protein